MGYPIFGKIKNIVLPLPKNDFNDMSIEEYKKFSGIDLRDVFDLDQVNKGIIFKQTNALYFFNLVDYNLYNNTSLQPLVIINPETYLSSFWSDVDELSAMIEISVIDHDGEGINIQFKISYQNDFDINNIKMSVNEI